MARVARRYPYRANLHCRTMPESATLTNENARTRDIAEATSQSTAYDDVAPVVLGGDVGHVQHWVRHGAIGAASGHAG